MLIAPNTVVMNISEIRKNYLLHHLEEETTGNDPIEFFLQWLSEALESQVIEPTAMVLSTVGNDCRPSSRVVLLKGCEEGEFHFYTNYNSAKGKQIEKHPIGSLVFHWKELERQVRIEGIITKLAPEKSDEYFNSRPLESRLGASISPQSEVIESREFLERMFQRKSEEINASGSLSRPVHWGGYALRPDVIEFWQGRASRLHDRLRFRLYDGKWIRERLAP